MLFNIVLLNQIFTYINLVLIVESTLIYGMLHQN